MWAEQLDFFRNSLPHVGQAMTVIAQGSGDFMCSLSSSKVGKSAQHKVHMYFVLLIFTNWELRRLIFESSFLSDSESLSSSNVSGVGFIVSSVLRILRSFCTGFVVTLFTVMPLGRVIIDLKMIQCNISSGPIQFCKA